MDVFGGRFVFVVRKGFLVRIERGCRGQERKELRIEQGERRKIDRRFAFELLIIVLLVLRTHKRGRYAIDEWHVRIRSPVIRRRTSSSS